MKHLIRHLLSSNKEEIITKSFLDCHVKGLHSIMLLECPGKTIRLYIAVPGNEMFRNTEKGIVEGTSSLSLHGHHCDLTLNVIKGKITNLIAGPVILPERGTNISVDKWLYHSAIKEGETWFEKEKSQDLLSISRSYTLLPDQSVFMPANEIHTVYCPVDKFSAWLVFEGAEDPNYRPVSWTNTDLSSQDFSSYYSKPTESQIMRLLETAGLLF